MSGDRPFLGILLMLCFCLLVPLSDSFAKILGATVALPVIVLARFLVQGAVLAALAAALRTGLSVPRALWPWVLARTLLFLGGMFLMFAALRVLPLADAVAIIFVMPFMLLILGHLFMGEEVGPMRWIACAVGFAGTLLVIRPNFAEVGAAALMPLGVALIFAVFMLITRRISRGVAPLPLQAVTGLLGSALLLPAVPLLVPWEAIRAPFTDPVTLGLLLAMGLFGTLAHLAMTASLRFAPAATLAPMQYLEIPFATLAGWAIFGDLPDGMAAAGIALTMGAGVFVIWRERVRARAPELPPAPA